MNDHDLLKLIIEENLLTGSAMKSIVDVMVMKYFQEFFYHDLKCYIMVCWSMMINMIDDMFVSDGNSNYPVKMQFQHKTIIPQRRAHEMIYFHQMTT